MDRGPTGITQLGEAGVNATTAQKSEDYRFEVACPFCHTGARRTLLSLGSTVTAAYCLSTPLEKPWRWLTAVRLAVLRKASSHPCDCTRGWLCRQPLPRRTSCPSIRSGQMMTLWVQESELPRGETHSCHFSLPDIRHGQEKPKRVPGRWLGE